MARDFLKGLNGLFKWAIEQSLFENNPALRIKRPPLKNEDGFPVKTEKSKFKTDVFLPILSELAKTL